MTTIRGMGKLTNLYRDVSNVGDHPDPAQMTAMDLSGAGSVSQSNLASYQQAGYLGTTYNVCGTEKNGVSITSDNLNCANTVPCGTDDARVSYSTYCRDRYIDSGAVTPSAMECTGDEDYWCVDSNSNYMRTLCVGTDHTTPGSLGQRMPPISGVKFTDEGTTSLGGGQVRCRAGGEGEGGSTVAHTTATRVDVGDNCRVTCEFNTSDMVPAVAVINDPTDRCVEVQDTGGPPSGVLHFDASYDACSGFCTDPLIDQELKDAIDNEMVRQGDTAIYDPTITSYNNNGESFNIGNLSWTRDLIAQHCDAEMRACLASGAPGLRTYDGSWNVATCAWSVDLDDTSPEATSSVISDEWLDITYDHGFPQFYPGAKEGDAYTHLYSMSDSQEYKDLYYCMLNNSEASRVAEVAPPLDCTAPQATPVGDIRDTPGALDSLCAGPSCKYNGKNRIVNPDLLYHKVDKIKAWREYFYTNHWENSCNYSLIMKELCGNIEYRPDYCNGKNYCSYFESTNPGLNDGPGPALHPAAGTNTGMNICRKWAHEVANRGNADMNPPIHANAMDDNAPFVDKLGSFEEKTNQECGNAKNHDHVETAIAAYCDNLYIEFPVPASGEGLDVARDPVCACYKSNDEK